MTISPSYSRFGPARAAATGERKFAKTPPIRLLPMIPSRSIRGVYCASNKSRCEWLELSEGKQCRCGYYGNLDLDIEAKLPTRDDECLQKRAPSRASQGRQLAPDLVLEVQGPKKHPDIAKGLTKGGTAIVVTNYANGVSCLKVGHTTVQVEEALYVIRLAHADGLMDQAVADRFKTGKIKYVARQLIGTIRDLFSGQSEKIKAEYEAAIKSLESEMEDV